MSEQIGFIGLGSMGRPIAEHLLKAGYSLRVYNRDKRKAEPLVAQGAEPVEKPGDVPLPGGIVITMVSNDAAVKSIVMSDGFLEHLGQGGVHISMSTIGPGTARELAEIHKQHGSSYVAAPVMGNPSAAAAKQLRVLLAGPPEARRRAEPVMKAVGQAIIDVGDVPERANVVKLCNNYVLASIFEGLAEALTLAEKCGVERTTVMDVLAQSLFSSPVISQNYGKMIAEKRHEPAGFKLSLGLKDLTLVLQTAGECQVPMPFADVVHDRLLSGAAKGRGDMDWSALALGVLEDAGLEVPRK